MVFQNQGLPFHRGRITGAFQVERGAFQVGAQAVPFCENSWGVSRSMSCGNRSTLREKPFHFLARAHWYGKWSLERDNRKQLRSYYRLDGMGID